mgnify:CR=1 FL=1
MSEAVPVLVAMVVEGAHDVEAAEVLGVLCRDDERASWIVNALTDEFHPCQILADFQTIAEHRGGVDNLKNQTIAYLGDAANNMANSYLLGGAVAGMNVRVAGPNGYLPDSRIVANAQAIASETGGSILVTTDPKEAVADADCVFTDTWVSMGEEAEYAIRSKPFWDYQVNVELMAFAKRRPSRELPEAALLCSFTAGCDLPALPAGLPRQGSHR